MEKQMEKLKKEAEYLNDKMEVFEKLQKIMWSFHDTALEKFGEDSEEELDVWEDLGWIEDKFRQAKIKYVELKKEIIQLRREIRENDTQK